LTAIVSAPGPLPRLDRSDANHGPRTDQGSQTEPRDV